MMSVPTATVSAMPWTMYCDRGNIGTLSFTSTTLTISWQHHHHQQTHSLNHRSQLTPTLDHFSQGSRITCRLTECQPELAASLGRSESRRQTKSQLRHFLDISGDSSTRTYVLSVRPSSSVWIRSRGYYLPPVSPLAQKSEHPTVFSINYLTDAYQVQCTYRARQKSNPTGKIRYFWNYSNYSIKFTVLTEKDSGHIVCKFHCNNGLHLKIITTWT